MSLGEIVVRGLNTFGTLVTGGLGMADGTTYTQGVSGSITMSGALTAQFIPSGATSAQKRGGVSITTDIAID